MKVVRLAADCGKRLEAEGSDYTKLKTHLLEGLVSEQLLVRQMERAAQKEKKKHWKTCSD